MPSTLFLPLIRELVSSFQAFEMYSAVHIRTLELTPPQFDIIATLGNTTGMTPKLLGERTLITKGTLTGVVDRLEHKGLVRRIASPSDGRSQIVQLSATGQSLFERIFPAHIKHLEVAFANLPEADLIETTNKLRALRIALSETAEAQRNLT